MSDEPIPSPPRVAAASALSIVVVGASTGGTDAIREVVLALPADAPGVVVVLHMPEAFTKGYATRLDRAPRAQVRVREAEDGDRIARGVVLLAPGGARHAVVDHHAGSYAVRLVAGPLVGHHRPSVDRLFESAAVAAGPNALGVLLTGMGTDGAKGLLRLKEVGARTIAQNERTSVVFGMARQAIELGAAEAVLPLSRIGPAIVAWAASRVSPSSRGA